MRNNSAQSVSFRSVSKAYGEVAALGQVDLEIKPGEFVALLGPSGSGKTTLLNIAAGFIEPTTGQVFIGDQDVTQLPPRRRNIGMMFQSYALFPHLSVFENIAYGLRVRKRPEDEIRSRVTRALTMVQMAGTERRRIGELSGGQQQRVALARAVAIDPNLLLMDEPLGALDRQLRKHMQLEIRRLHREIGGTTIYVTHDQEEALVMADRVGVMRAGRLEQIGRPDELYKQPKNTFVAAFLGESNLFSGRIIKRQGKLATISVPELELEISGRCHGGLTVGDKAAALLRPENIRFGQMPGNIRGRVVEVVYLGELYATKVRLTSGQEVWSRTFSFDRALQEGEEVTAQFNPDDVLILETDDTREEIK